MIMSHIAITAAHDDSILLIEGGNMENLIKARVSGGIVSDPLYTATLCHLLPYDLQEMLLTVLEKFYFDY